MFKHEQLIFLMMVVSCRLRCIKCIMEGKIVGGNFARIENFPHSVFLSVKCFDMKWICGASILNQRILITAGHCVFQCDVRKEEDLIEAFMGNENLQRAKIIRTVTDFIIHEEYNDDSIENDIAIVKTQTSIPLCAATKRVIISKIWPYRAEEPGFGIVAGWGMNNDTEEVRSPHLMSVTQKMRSPILCNNALGPLSPGMFCAGSMDSDDPHAAKGDSGSALIFKNSFQIGIVSFKVKAFPAMMVYTNTTFFYSWIRKKAVKLFCRFKYTPNSS